MTSRETRVRGAPPGRGRRVLERLAAHDVARFDSRRPRPSLRHGPRVRHAPAAARARRPRRAGGRSTGRGARLTYPGGAATRCVPADPERARPRGRGGDRRRRSPPRPRLRERGVARAGGHRPAMAVAGRRGRCRRWPCGCRTPTGSSSELVAQYGPADTRASLEVGNEPPPVTLRVNTERATVEAVADELRAGGVEVEPRDARGRGAPRARDRRSGAARRRRRRAGHAAGPGQPGRRAHPRSAARRDGRRRRRRARRQGDRHRRAGGAPRTGRRLRSASRAHPPGRSARRPARARPGPPGRRRRPVAAAPACARSTGCWSTRRAAASACCAAAPSALAHPAGRSPAARRPPARPAARRSRSGPAGRGRSCTRCARSPAPRPPASTSGRSASSRNSSPILRRARRGDRAGEARSCSRTTPARTACMSSVLRRT